MYSSLNDLYQHNVSRYYDRDTTVHDYQRLPHPLALYVDFRERTQRTPSVTKHGSVGVVVSNSIYFYSLLSPRLFYPWWTVDRKAFSTIMARSLIAMGIQGLELLAHTIFLLSMMSIIPPFSSLSDNTFHLYRVVNCPEIILIGEP